MLWDCVVEEQRDHDGLWIHGFVFCPFQIHLFCLLWPCFLKQETTKLRKLIAGVCCLPKSGSQSGNAGLGQWSCKWKNWHCYTICKCCRVSPSSVSLSYLQWTVDIVDYNSSFKFNRIVRLLMKVVLMKCDFFPEDDRYHDSSPLIDRDLSQCQMCWFKGIYQYNQNEKFLCASLREWVIGTSMGWQMLLWRKEGKSMRRQEWWSVRGQKSPQKKHSQVTANALVIATNSPINHDLLIHAWQTAKHTYAIGLKLPKGFVKYYFVASSSLLC